MPLPERFIEELVSRTDLAGLVSQYTEVRQRGAEWVCRCPFHNEKTPSFYVFEDNSRFYCFGCQAGGTAVQFLMRADRLEFIDAVRELARRAHMELPEDDAPQGMRRSRLLEINRLAGRWFYDNLSRPEGAAALTYLQKRGLSPKIVRRFGIGAAPDSWSALRDYVKTHGVSFEEAAEAGLVTKGTRPPSGDAATKSNYIDAFRNRLMFPIFDTGGQVIAFSGRALSDEQKPKYKNSPETSVYHKKRALYGLHLAKKSERPYYLLVEGNVDVPILHQHGIDCAVATCGTALTEEQVALLKNAKNEVVLAYDSDEAGRNATQKAIVKLEAAGLKIRVLTLTGAKDPDEYIRRYGPGAFDALLTGASNHMDYRFQQLTARFDLTQDMGKRDFLREAEDMLAALPTEAERQLYARRAAELAGVTQEAILKDLAMLGRRGRRRAERALERSVLYPRTPVNRTEEAVIMHMARGAEYIEKARSALTDTDFTDETLRALFRRLCDDGLGVLAALPEAQASVLVRLQCSGVTVTDESFAACTERLRMSRLRTAAVEDDSSLLAMQQALRDKKKYGG